LFPVVMNFQRYRHDRTKPIDQSIKELCQFIEEFTDQSALEIWYDWFSDNFGLPKTVVKQFLMRKLAEGFDYIDRRGFKNRLLATSVTRAQLAYVAYIAFILGRRNKKCITPHNCHLLIDHIESISDLNRYQKLIKLFHRKNVVVVTPLAQPLKSSDALIVNRPRRSYRTGFRNYQIKNSEIIPLISGLRTHKLVSYEIGANLVYISMRIIDSLFYYRTLFNDINAKYLINHQHYHTDSVKNYLFKACGGNVSAVIQKNIHQYGPNGFFYDADVFFTYGSKTANSAIRLGASFDNVASVGSFFFESRIDPATVDLEMRWHVICIGGNGFTTPEVLRFTDTYDSNLDDYIEHLKWMHRLSLEYPDLRLGFKHHPGYSGKFEDDFFQDSNVQLIRDSDNTYEQAFRSGMTVSWASTVILELRGHGRLAFFLNPGGRNSQFVVEDFQSLNFVTYQEFSHKVLQFRHSAEIPELGYLDSDCCMPSDKVSEKIHRYLTQSSDNNAVQSNASME